MWKLTITQYSKGENYPITDKVIFTSKVLHTLTDIITVLVEMEGEILTEYKIERVDEDGI